MATVTGLTAARMLVIEALSVVGGAISGDNLILTRKNGTTINAGNVRGPAGPQGVPGSITVSPAGGDLSGNYPNPVIKALAVSTAKIIDLAVTTPKLADAAVTTPKLADNSVTSAKIVDGTITDGDVSVDNKDGAVDKASMRTIGSGAQQAAAGNHFHAITTMCNRTASSVTAIPNTSFTLLPVPDGTLENFDYANGIFTVKTAGVYAIAPMVHFAANTTGRRILALQVNGVEVKRKEQPASNVSAIFGLDFIHYKRLEVGDTFAMWAYQSSGGSLNTAISSDGVRLEAVRINR